MGKYNNRPQQLSFSLEASSIYEPALFQQQILNVLNDCEVMYFMIMLFFFFYDRQAVARVWCNY